MITEERKCSVCEGELHIGTYLDKKKNANFYVFCPKCDHIPVKDVITPDDDD